MLACDLLMDVRASHTISAEQMVRLERMIFGDGTPDGDQLDLLYLIDTYLQRPDPRWADLLARAASLALTGGTGKLAPAKRLARAA